MFTLLKNEWKARIRSAFSGKDVAITVILAFFALYMLLNILALAFFLPEIIRGGDEGGPIFTELNQILFYYFLVDFVFRFFLQSFPLLSVQPLLIMPIDRRKVFHFILLRSVPNFFNVLPLVLALPLVFRAVIPEKGALVGITWLVMILLVTLFNHYLVFYLKRMFTVRPAVVLVLVSAIGGLFYLDQQGIANLSGGFAQFVAQLTAQPYWLLIPGLAAGLAYGFLFQRFRRYAYLDAFISNRGEPVSTRQFSWLDRFGNLGDLMRLDLMLIWRNKRPRTMMLFGLLFILYPLLFVDIMQESFAFAIFIGIFMSGVLMMQYGQFMLSWESTFFDFMLTRNFRIREYFEAKYLFLSFSIIAFTLITMIYGFIFPQLIPVLLACGLFNVGVNTIILMYSATYNVKKIELTKGAFFNYEGVGANQFVMIIPLILVPILIYMPFGILGQRLLGIAVIGILGIIGIIFRDRLITLVENQFQRRKYTMSAGFKAN